MSFTIGLALASYPVFAQITKKPGAKLLATSWKLVSVKVSGSTHYSPEEIINASGLQIGEVVSEDDFKKATEHLGETGAFTGVQYAFEYSSAGAKLELQLTDNPQLVGVRFDNLVWFSDAELMEKLKASVPLFHGQLPLSGNLADLVSDALQTLLIQRKLLGRVDYMRSSPINGLIDAFVYSVTAHNIHIRNTDFSGADPSVLPLLQAAARPLHGMDYRRAMVRDNEKHAFLPVYLQHGYLKAAFGDAQPKMVEETPQDSTIDLIVPVEPGLQYKFTEMTWLGNKAFPAQQLQSLIQLKSGQPADAIQLGENLREIAKLYGTRGYMALHVDPSPQMDDANSTVSYEMKVREGEVYHMGELEIRGLDGRDVSRLTLNWRLHEGDVYDSSYIPGFLKDSLADLSGQNWKTSFHEAVNDSDQTVDVGLQFEAR